MSYPSPILRIEVEGVKHAIVQHLGASAQEFTDIVTEEIEAFDIPAMVRDEIRLAAPLIIRQAVQDAGKQISQALTKKIVEEMRDQAWDAAIKRAVEQREQA